MFSYVVRQAICILNVCFVYGAAMLSPGRQRVTLSTSEGCLLLDNWEDVCLSMVAHWCTHDKRYGG